MPGLFEKNSVKPESHVSVDAVGGVERPLVGSGCKKNEKKNYLRV